MERGGGQSETGRTVVSGAGSAAILNLLSTSKKESAVHVDVETSVASCVQGCVRASGGRVGSLVAPSLVLEALVPHECFDLAAVRAIL